MRKLLLNDSAVKLIAAHRIQGIYIGPSLDAIRYWNCFGGLGPHIKDAKTKTMYFAWYIPKPSKLSPIEIVKDLKNIFGITFLITLSSTQHDEVFVVKIKQRPNANDIFIEAGYNLIGVFLRAMDMEPYMSVWKDYRGKKITNIKDMLLHYYNSRGNHGHGVSDLLYTMKYLTKLDNKDFILGIEKYLKTIKTVFGAEEFDLSNETLGKRYYDGYISGHGHTFAYSLIERLVKGDLK